MHPLTYAHRPWLHPFFFFNDTATTEIYTLSLHDALPIFTTIFRNMIPRMTGGTGIQANWLALTAVNPNRINIGLSEGDRKSTRLNSSHVRISYAVFWLKKHTVGPRHPDHLLKHLSCLRQL